MAGALMDAHRPETGRWHLQSVWGAARAAGATTCLLSLGLFAASLPARYQQLLAIGAGDPSLADPLRGIDPARIQAALARLNLTADFYAAGNLAFEVVFALTFGLVALAVARQRQHRWFSLLATVTLVLDGTTYPPTLTALSLARPDLVLLVRLLGALSFAFGLLMLYVFPDGRLVPRWLGPPVGAWIAWQISSAAFPTAPFSPLAWPPLLAVVVWIPWWLSGIAVQVYRYHHVSSPAQRQQTKWLLWGLAAAVVGANAALLLPHLLVLSPSANGLEALVALGATPLGEGFLLLAPLALGVAIHRYRLLDVDVLINRTLVYGTLSLLLAGVYLGGVVFLQSSLRALAGQVSDLTTVGSTLAVAALSQPLHRRVQGLIDRSFYRRKYDATQVLGAFGATARDEVDLGQLTTALLRLVEDAMQPAHLSLWLRRVGPEARRGESLGHVDA
jgi:hypothetical protein